MIDLNLFRQNPEAYAQAAKQKRSSFDVMAFFELDKRYRELLQGVEELRKSQNQAGKEVPKLEGEAKKAKLSELKDLSSKLKSSEESLKELEAEWKSGQLFLCSIPLAKVPEGRDDSENVQVRTWGDIPQFGFTPKSHVELGEELALFDIERGVKIAGSRSYFLTGNGARLQHAVLSFARDLLYKRGYNVMDCPHIVTYDAMQGTSYFPGGEDAAYHLDERDEGFYLIGTSEVSVCAFHGNEILDLESLPKRYAGYSPCYRREAGTYGKDTFGLYRIHQFYKVEQVVLCQNDDGESAKLHEELLKNAEDLVQALGLPYRVVDVCTGDMGQGQVYKNDIEVWMPSRESYGETHSCSTFHDFQARRLKIRYRDKDGNTTYCHTLNNTLVASPRILIPLLEVHQQEDGSVLIPEPLRPYMGGEERLCKGEC